MCYKIGQLRSEKGTVTVTEKKASLTVLENGTKSLNSPIKNSDFGTAKAPYLRHILYISPNSPILFIVIKNKYKNILYI
ncbi:MAG: hypothetical protein D8H95_00095 [Lachnospiraceae bacterium]|jgi:hypothetical protein|nr:MAG: hypothetical protein D8H95_00095 [Lachnospiraceae bacterium]